MRICFAIMLAFAFAGANAQTVFWTENFTSGGTGWSLAVVLGAEGTDANFFKVSANEGGGITPDLGAPGSCGAANNGNNTLHVTSVYNPTGGAAYDAGGLCGILYCPQANRRAESPVINCTGYSTISLHFHYIENGETTNDNATVMYYDGSTWTTLDDMPKTLTGCGGQGLWTSRTIALPASANNNPNVKIAFRWVNNDDGVGTDPSFAVDDISLTVPSGVSPPVANFSSSDTTICVGQCLNFNDLSTNTPTSWLWSFTGAATTSSTAQNPTVICYNSAGSFTVSLTATNAGGSDIETKTAFITVVALPSVTASASVNPVCAGQSTTLNGGGASTYTWDQGLSSGASHTVTPSGTTTYQVTGTDAAGCSNTAQVVVTVNALPTIGITGTSVICVGDNATLTASGGSGYNWSTTETTTSITVSPTVTTVYSVTGSNATCSNTASFQVNVNTVPVATITGPASVCAGGTVTLTASGGAGTYNYSWSTTEATAAIDVSPSATTTYTVTVSAGTCSDTETHTVMVNALPVIGITGNNSICAGGSVVLTASGGSGYLWNTSETTSAITVSPSVTTTYSVTGTNGTCSNSATFSVTVAPLPNISISGTNSICEGESVVLTASGGTGYFWNTAETTAAITVTPTATQSYSVTGTDGTCDNVASVTITVNTNPVAQITGDTVVCSGSSTLLIASGGSSYLWNTSASTSSISIVPSSGQYYSVTVSNGPCSDADSIFVTVNPLPLADAGADTTIYLGSSVDLSASGGITYFWSPPEGLSCTDCSDPVATPESTTTYTLLVTDANGCTATDEITITVEYNCGEVWAPDAFSPNNDGFNDVFILRGNCIETILFRVYDRWGEKVFETRVPGEGWNGEFNGDALNGGVYSYYYSGTLITGETITGKGDVTLIK